jgi:hypothetical protein
LARLARGVCEVEVCGPHWDVERLPGAQLVIATYLDTDEAPDNLIVRTAMIARDPEDW